MNSKAHIDRAREKLVQYKEKELLDAYYMLRGWNNDGIPTSKYLKELGLDYVADEFIRRGILTEAETENSRGKPRKI